MNTWRRVGSSREAWVEGALAVAAFAALCVLVLSVAPQTAEPDDGAYRASTVAITEGHFLTLSIAQAETLARKLGDNPAAPPNQWVELSGGRYISEKDPGYPYLAAPFEALGCRRERHAEGVVLPLVPGRAQSELRAPTGEHVERGDDLGEQPGMAVGHAAD